MRAATGDDVADGAASEGSVARRERCREAASNDEDADEEDSEVAEKDLMAEAEGSWSQSEAEEIDEHERPDELR